MEPTQDLITFLQPPSEPGDGTVKCEPNQQYDNLVSDIKGELERCNALWESKLHALQKEINTITVNTAGAGANVTCSHVSHVNVDGAHPQVMRYEPKLKVLSGTCDNLKTVSIKEWIADAKDNIEQLRWDKVQSAQYLLRYLAGPARSRLRNCAECVREDPDQVLRVIRETYGGPESYTELEEKFVQRKQGEEEDIWAYSDALLDIDRTLQAIHPMENEWRQERLKERFVRNLRNKVFGLSIRRYLEEHRTVNFEELVKVAAKRAREEQHGFVSESDKLKKGHNAVVKEIAAGEVANQKDYSDSAIERLEGISLRTAEAVNKLISLQEKSMERNATLQEQSNPVCDGDMQCNRVHAGTGRSFYGQGRNNWPRRGSQYREPRQGFRGQCYNCGNVGHMAYQCKVLQPGRNGSANSAGSIPISGQQVTPTSMGNEKPQLL